MKYFLVCSILLITGCFDGETKPTEEDPKVQVCNMTGVQLVSIVVDYIELATYGLANGSSSDFTSFAPGNIPTTIDKDGNTCSATIQGLEVNKTYSLVYDGNDAILYEADSTSATCSDRVNSGVMTEVDRTDCILP